MFAQKVPCFRRLLLLPVMLFGIAAGAQTATPEIDFVPGELLVGLRPGVSLRSEDGVGARFGVPSLDTLSAQFPLREVEALFPGTDAETLAVEAGLDRILRLRFGPGVDVLAARAAFLTDPNIEFVELNRVVVAFINPSDARFPNQWGLHNTGQSSGRRDADIDAPEAWDRQKGAASTVIAVLDTGVDYRHPDLQGGKVLTDRDYDFVNDDTDAMDDHGHGTYCAGIAAANTNNRTGIAGVCWHCKILPIKVLNSEGSGDAAGLAEGIRYAVDRGASVISMSLGWDSSCSCSQTVARAINYAFERGVLLVAATGNDGDKQATGYPASSPRVLGVGATDRFDREADFSNRDNNLDVYAPGVDVLSLDLTSRNPIYRIASGTSAATPFVAGVAGLMRSARPNLTPAQVWQALRSSADRVIPRSTIGRLNARVAVERAPRFSHPAPVDSCSTEPEGCSGGCFAELSLGGKTGTVGLGESLTVMREVRDLVLAKTALGQRWLGQAQRHWLEVGQQVVLDAELREATRAALTAWAPIFQAALRSHPTPQTQVTSRQVELARRALDHLEALASDELRNDLSAERANLEARVFVVGRSPEELLEALAAPVVSSPP